MENTLRAAEAAIVGGFSIECDIQISKDGKAFVFHDETLERLTGAPGPFNERTAVEIAKLRISGADEPAAFAAFLDLVAGRTPIVCELKSHFDGDFRLASRAATLAATYGGPLAFESFDHDLMAYMRFIRPRTRSGTPCPLGIVAQASYDDASFAALTLEQKRDWTDFDVFDRNPPDFLSWNVDDLPHKIPFLMKEFHGAPVLAWTVRTPHQREAARKWADQIVFEGGFPT